MPEMSRARQRFVHALLAVVLTGSAYAVVTGQEAWPFSPYPMYAKAERQRTLIRYETFGIQEDRSEIRLDGRHLRPFIISRFSTAIKELQADPARRGRVSEAVEDCLRRYDRLRLSGKIQGPPLIGMRLYRTKWQLDPLARNIDQPVERLKLAEILR